MGADSPEITKNELASNIAASTSNRSCSGSSAGSMEPSAWASRIAVSRWPSHSPVNARARSYGASPGATGLFLAVAAGAYVAGNLSGRRLARYEASSVLVVLALLLAVTNGMFGLIRTDPLLSTAFLSAAGFLSGGRTLVASTFALSAPPALRPTVMRLRASTMQFGSFLGSIAGGLALAVGGYRAFGATMGSQGLEPWTSCV